MKICDIDDDIYKIFLNDLEIKNINVASEKSLESTIRGVILRLKSKYDIVQYGAIGLESLQYTVTNTDQTIKIINNKE